MQRQLSSVRSGGMTTYDGDDLLRANYGRCGKPLMRSVEDLGDRRTIDCEECEKALPMWCCEPAS